MGFEFDRQHHRRSTLSNERAEKEYQRNAQITQQVLTQLPNHRDLINKIHKYGMQAI